MRWGFFAPAGSLQMVHRDIGGPVAAAIKRIAFLRHFYYRKRTFRLHLRPWLMPPRVSFPLLSFEQHRHVSGLLLFQSPAHWVGRFWVAKSHEIGCGQAAMGPIVQVAIPVGARIAGPGFSPMARPCVSGLLPDRQGVEEWHRNTCIFLAAARPKAMVP